MDSPLLRHLRKGRGTAPVQQTIARPIESPLLRHVRGSRGRAESARTREYMPDSGRLHAAVEWVESRGKAHAVSPKGAIGPMQTMPNTLRDPGYGVKPAKDRSVSELRRVGRDYADAMVKKYGLVGGLAAYNWGPGNWEKALKEHNGNVDRALQSAPKETRNYIPQVMEQLNRR